jgi:hypothetical protein
MLGCFGRLVGVGILALVLWGAWTFGPGLAASAGWRTGVADSQGGVPSEERSNDAVNRLTALMDGQVDQAVFSSLDLESLARFHFAEAWPLGVVDPEVQLRDGEVYLSFRVASEWIPVLPELESIRGLLPDTVPVALRGRILTLEGGDASVLVHRIEAASVPIPRRLFGAILDPLRIGSRPGLPPEALLVPLPAGIGSVWIEGRELMLRRAQ